MSGHALRDDLALDDLEVGRVDLHELAGDLEQLRLGLVAATATALPPMNVPREANVPVQSGEESVLETSIVTQS